MSLEDQKKVLVLHYAEPNGSNKQIHGECRLVLPNDREFDYKVKEFLHGKIKMFYTDISNTPNIKVNGVVYYGPVTFMEFDESGNAVSISKNQIRAIKLMVNKLW